VTEDNLDLLADKEKGCRFITTLPRTYKECREVVAWAVEQTTWQDIGIISPQRPTTKRKPVHYRGFESEVDLYGRRYRALVVHSDALDKKSVKKFEREMEQDKADLTKIKVNHDKLIYACLPDAQRALSRLQRGKFHCVAGEIYEVPHYPKGRPKDSVLRTPTRIDYRLNLRLEPDDEAISRWQHEAGCFVLLTNIPEESMASYDLLATYKAQDMVERNFGFLKDEAIVNSLFLKTPARIEVLGLILVFSLMIWRLMERSMRLSLQLSGSKVEGWDKKPTSSPTSLMIAHMFLSMVVIRIPGKRFLSNGMNATQLEYLKILDVSHRVFVDPHG
jgi:transposase